MQVRDVYLDLIPDLAGELITPVFHILTLIGRRGVFPTILHRDRRVSDVLL